MPLVLFGSTGYGARQGGLGVPMRVAQALAPFAFGIVLDRLHAGAPWVTAGIGLAAFAALVALHARTSASGATPAMLTGGTSR